MDLYYPVKAPINEANLFGTPGPIYAASGQKGHPGIDFECPSGTPVYAPCDGAAFYVTDFDYLVKEGIIPAGSAPEKAGCGIWIRTPDNVDTIANVILWHMHAKETPGFPYAIPTDGSVTQVKAGQLLGYSDNSGYPVETNGPHLHLGYMPCDKTGEALNPENGFKGCVDPEPLFNGHYAEDIAAVEAVVASVTTVVNNIATTPGVPVSQKLDWLQELAILIQKLW